MKVFVGQVKSNLDGTGQGILRVISKDRGEIPVYYTSPFGGGHTSDGKSGFFAIPAANSWILFVESDSEPFDYYYLSTIHRDLADNTKKNAEVKVWKKLGEFPQGLYGLNPGEPSRCVFMDPIGNKLIFNHSRNKNTGIICGIELSSRDKKRFLLSDNPESYGIFLLNEEDDGISITSGYRTGHTAGPFLAPRQIAITAKGKVDILSKNSSISMKVKDGQDIVIENTSFGLNNFVPAVPFAGPPAVANLFPYGNIRLHSSVRDIYIHAGQQHQKFQKTLGVTFWNGYGILGHRSRVMLRAFGQNSTIQLSSDGSIIIRAPNDSIYLHGRSINIKGELGVNIESKLGVNIAAGTTVKMSANLLGLGAFGEEFPDPRVAAGVMAFPNDVAEAVYDQSLYARSLADPAVALATPTQFGHIELGIGATIQGARVDIAPVTPTFRAFRAVHPPQELGEYETGIPGSN